MEELKVKNAIISKQPENSENFKDFLRIVKEKKIKVSLVEAGNRLNIEKNLYFDILWPVNNEFISENALNNNSIVCKLVYKNFSLLCTGDIEKVAENAIHQKYQNNLNILKSTILKVAHHGSKSSSIQELLDVIQPKIALIGVGASNTFGHPNQEVLKRITDLRSTNI